MGAVLDLATMHPVSCETFEIWTPAQKAELKLTANDDAQLAQYKMYSTTRRGFSLERYVFYGDKRRKMAPTPSFCSTENKER